MSAIRCPELDSSRSTNMAVVVVGVSSSVEARIAVVTFRPIDPIGSRANGVPEGGDGLKACCCFRTGVVVRASFQCGVGVS